MSPESTEDVCYSPFNSEGGGANSNDHSYNAILLQTPVDVTACPSIDNPSKTATSCSVSVISPYLRWNIRVSRLHRAIVHGSSRG